MGLLLVFEFYICRLFRGSYGFNLGQRYFIVGGLLGEGEFYGYSMST